MRLFAAIELSEDVSEGLQGWWAQASDMLTLAGWRPTPAHLWHLTLAFYGDVGADDADDLSEQLSECAAHSASLHLQTGRFGVFPRPAHPRVFWAGVDDVGHEKSLKRLAHCCRRAGHATVRKRSAREAAFRGHITVARASGSVTPLDDGRMQTMPPVPPVPKLYWRADCFSLFQSILRPEGPQYRRLETFY